MFAKPKVFVRFIPGASGNFVALLLQNMFQDVSEQHAMGTHIDSWAVWGNHNLNLQSIGNHTYGKGNFGQTEEFKKHTSADINLFESIKYMKDNFSFFETDSPIYTVPTHALNPAALMCAFDNTKLINVKSTKEDIDQIIYNSVTKFVIPRKTVNLVQKALLNFKGKHPDKYFSDKFLTVLNKNNFDDERFLCYLYKFSSTHNEFNDFELGECYTYKDIPFLKLQTNDITYDLENIAEYIGLPLTKERKEVAIKLLHEYSVSQKPNPYTDLHIDDY